MTLLVFPFSPPQILMNVQWIQAHVAQERVWIWMDPTGVSALPVTICMRKPVKVQQTEICFFFQLGLRYMCPRCRGAQKENKPFFSTSSFSSITSLLQIALHLLFLMWEGARASSGSICLYSGADEEIFSRLQHVPYVLSSRKKGQQQQILSKSNISSRLLQRENMWHGGYYG